MVHVNFALKEINCKIVYYGPGMSGKTTNLIQIHTKAPDRHRGNLTSIATEGDRTLFFDFLPIDIGTVNGMKTKFQLYTVPGQVYYNSTRKLVLQGVDGVIFVADSQRKKMRENLESLKNLEINLCEYGFNITDIPLIIQFNKRDLPDVIDTIDMNKELNTLNVPTFESVASTGEGVIQTFKAMASIVLEDLNKKAKKSTDIGNVNNNVAEVSGEKIKWNDFKKYCQIQSRLAAKGKNTPKLSKENEKRLLGSLINYTLLLQEARKRNIEAKDTEVKRQLKQFIAKHGSQTSFQDYLGKHNLTIEDIKGEVVKNILISKLIQMIFPDFIKMMRVANRESSDPKPENILKGEEKKKIIAGLYLKLRAGKDIKIYLHNKK